MVTRKRAATFSSRLVSFRLASLASSALRPCSGTVALFPSPASIVGTFTSPIPCHPSLCHEQRRCCISLRGFLFLYIRLSPPLLLRHHSRRSTFRTTRAPFHPVHTCPL